MTNTTRYSINHSKIVFEKFDDEVVLINLDNGNYFSILEVAGIVWGLIDKGFNREEAAKLLSELFGTPEAELEIDIQLFIEQLVSEELISISSIDSHTTVEAISVQTSGKVYAKPVLEVYSDMQDLILLDPIHEVDETGWPNVKKETESSEK
jgi:hypothetical protein